MTFQLITNAHTFAFNYKALLDNCEYSGFVHLTNPNTAPEIFGSFFESTPTAKYPTSLANVRQWFDASNGALVVFPYFKTLPHVAGTRYRITGEIADLAGNLKIQMWEFVSGLWVKKPYNILQAIPVSTTTLGLSISAANKVIGGTVGQSFTGTFGFKIVPTEDRFTYNRHTISEIPWRTVPYNGLGYLNT
jgi:hypothetical protein